MREKKLHIEYNTITPLCSKQTIKFIVLFDVGNGAWSDAE